MDKEFAEVFKEEIVNEGKIEELGKQIAGLAHKFKEGKDDVMTMADEMITNGAMPDPEMIKMLETEEADMVIHLIAKKMGVQWTKDNGYGEMRFKQNYPESHIKKNADRLIEMSKRIKEEVEIDEANLNDYVAKFKQKMGKTTYQTMTDWVDGIGGLTKKEISTLKRTLKPFTEASTYRDKAKDEKKKKHFAFGGKKKSRHGESGYAKGEEMDREFAEAFKEEIEERKMTDAEMAEREEIVKKMKPKLQSFKDRYGDDAKKVMYATATKQAMEEVEIEEKKSATGYELYHKTFSDAMQHAYAHAKSKGFVVDPKEIDDKVATGPKKPSSGKTNRYSLKAGRKKVEIQVANLDNKRYELNMYIEEVELDEAFSMGKGDKRVVDAFYDQKEIKAHGASILTTDGKTLTKRGMGGQDIAKWVNGKIKIVAVSDVKSTELILKYMKKSIPSGVFEEMVIESTKEYAKSLEKIAKDKQLKMLTKSERENLLKIADLLAKERKEEVEIDEAEIATSIGSGGTAGLDLGLNFKKKKEDVKKAKALRKQMVGEEVQRTTFAGKDVFIVDSETYYNCRLGKKKYGRYEKYVGKGKVGQTIREYGLKYPRRPIILQNGESGPMLFLKYGRS